MSAFGRKLGNGWNNHISKPGCMLDIEGWKWKRRALEPEAKMQSKWSNSTENTIKQKVGGMMDNGGLRTGGRIQLMKGALCLNVVGAFPLIS
jgi:hypothetical protein